ncbi:hypothetical protein [Massilia sp. DD77]|uniref:hypothetical protein n=1 Tax=Massilia sp. DD77 TaxID=3109349 RepID=UPI003000A0A0
MNETTRAYFAGREKTERGALGNAMRAWLKNPRNGRAADLIEADEGETGLTRTRCVTCAPTGATSGCRSRRGTTTWTTGCSCCAAWRANPEPMADMGLDLDLT